MIMSQDWYDFPGESFDLGPMEKDVVEEMMLDKPMMQVWWREWVQEVKKDIVDDDDIFEYKIHYDVESLKKINDKKE